MNRGLTTLLNAAALGLLAAAGCGADVPGYTFSAPICAKGETEGSAFQMGRVNNKGQFSCVINVGGERVFVWDGTKVLKLSDDSIKLPDGSAFSTGNVWTSLGINDNGKVAWVADTDASVAGVRYIVTYDLKSGQYEIIAKPGLPVPGGGTFGDGENFGPTNRMLADINNKDQVAWNQAISGGDADGHSGIFLYDPATKKTTALARPGAVVEGKKLTNGWWPSINDAGQVAFIGDVENSDDYGIYLADSKGNLTAIAPAGTKVEGLTISSARWPSLANNGDIVFVGDTGASQGGSGEGTDDTAVFLYSTADKKLHVVVKPGDALPGGSTWKGVEPSRRVVQANSRGQVAMIGVRADDRDGIYLWQGGKLQALILGNSTVPGLGKVDGVSKGVGGVTGYHFAMSENGYVVFPAVVDGTECFVEATPPATPPAAGE